MACGAEIPFTRLRIVPLHAISLLVKVADSPFRLRQVLVRRFSVPIQGLLVIALYAKTLLEHSAHIELPQRIACCAAERHGSTHISVLNSTSFVICNKADYRLI